jgi:dienelactone hydrolase
MKRLLFGAVAVLVACSIPARADDSQSHDRPLLEFISFPSVDLSKSPPAPLEVKAKLSIPRQCRQENESRNKDCAAVVILHGSSGIDGRGDFYAQALNQAGLVTLEVDMWEARGVVGATNRPPLPIFNYPDAFGALSYLAGRPEVDRDRIGELGFSWGAVVTMASATTLYAGQFSAPNSPVFAAHVAHYPVCWAYNSVYPPVIGKPIPGLAFGTRPSGLSAPLSGAPVLIQIGSEDSYDEGAGPCLALHDNLIPAEQSLVQVNVYESAYHGWDRLLVPVTGVDPFSHLGAGGTIQVVPSPDQAYQSRDAVVEFMKQHLHL